MVSGSFTTDFTDYHRWFEFHSTNQQINKSTNSSEDPCSSSSSTSPNHQITKSPNSSGSFTTDFTDYHRWFEFHSTNQQINKSTNSSEDPCSSSTSSSSSTSPNHQITKSPNSSGSFTTDFTDYHRWFEFHSTNHQITKSPNSSVHPKPLISVRYFFS